MGRRLIWVIVVWVCGGAAIAAQAVAPPEGWVVLPAAGGRR